MGSTRYPIGQVALVLLSVVAGRRGGVAQLTRRVPPGAAAGLAAAIRLAGVRRRIANQ